MSDIPAARELVKVAREKIALGQPDALSEAGDLLARAETMMYREAPSHPKAPPQYGCTPRQKRQILSLKRRFPRMPLAEIAYRVGTGIGRVSEVLAGKR